MRQRTPESWAVTRSSSYVFQFFEEHLVRLLFASPGGSFTFSICWVCFLLPQHQPAQNSQKIETANGFSSFSINKEIQVYLSWSMGLGEMTQLQMPMLEKQLDREGTKPTNNCWYQSFWLEGQTPVVGNSGSYPSGAVFIHGKISPQPGAKYQEPNQHRWEGKAELGLGKQHLDLEVHWRHWVPHLKFDEEIWFGKCKSK